MALVRCYEEKAHLVSIADEAEQSYVVSLVRNIRLLSVCSVIFRRDFFTNDLSPRKTAH